MSTRSRRCLVLLQLAAAALLFVGAAQSQEGGSRCETVGARRCTSCYMAPNEGGWVAAVDGHVCTWISDTEKAWAVMKMFESSVTPLTTAGCADARGQCDGWKEEGDPE